MTATLANTVSGAAALVEDCRICIPTVASTADLDSPRDPLARDEPGGGGAAAGPFLLHRHLPTESDLKSMMRDFPPAEEEMGEEEGEEQQGGYYVPAEAVDAPRVTAEAGFAELSALSDREVRSARADVFGGRLCDHRGGDRRLDFPGDRMDRAVDDLELEMRRVCAAADAAADGHSAAASLNRARRVFPFLAASPHARQFLLAGGLDAERAAARIGRFWFHREGALGPVESFGADSVASPSDEEMSRIADAWDYSVPPPKKLSSSNDKDDAAPALDPETRRVAACYLRDWESRKLSAMDEEVDRLPLRAKAKLFDARSRDYDSVYSVQQRRLFLQGAGFDPRAAARRMAKYWDLKYHLFGYDGALDSVALTEESYPEFRSGVFFLLPGRDEFGRSIVCYHVEKLPQGADRAALDRVLRVMWYVLHMAMVKKGASRNGLVLLCIPKNMTARHFPTIDFINKSAALLFKSIPLKIRALHCCLPPDAWWFRVCFSIGMYAIGREGRSRKLVHRGMTGEEVAEVMESTYGISREQLPRCLGGNLGLDYVDNWLDDCALEVWEDTGGGGKGGVSP